MSDRIDTSRARSLKGIENASQEERRAWQELAEHQERSHGEDQ
jgi:hypothetical protein